ncbi:PE-PGRS family protein [Streptomyces sp. HSW2009]|uniref:5-methylcytosine restriction system specificity protein McrC n=1 Tax=Streptomyces sp. HSW2009 TaxID=3142890 RepID=UPI0032EDF96E
MPSAVAPSAATPQVILTGFDEAKPVPRTLLYGADLAKLRALKVVDIRERGADYLLKARDKSGVLQLERLRLVLRPKFTVAGDRLIDWLCYARRQPPPEPTLRNWLIGHEGYAELVPAALLHECRQLLARGLRRAYVRRSRVDTALRGRLDVTAQATRCFGAVDRLYLETFEYEDGGWENLVCGAALTVAAQPGPDARPQALRRETAAHFPRPPRPADARPLLARAQYTRLNQHYRAAHGWARMVLAGGGVRDLLDPYGFAARSLLLDLSTLWEHVVRRMAADAAAECGGRLAGPTEGHIVTAGGLTEKEPSFNPDVLLAFPEPDGAPQTTRFLVVDAKYKRYGDKNVTSPDRHQLLTYIAGYTDAAAPLALVVHPSETGPTRRVLRVTGPRGLLGLIEVLGLDTSASPELAAEPLRESIRGFAGRVGV